MALRDRAQLRLVAIEHRLDEQSRAAARAHAVAVERSRAPHGGDEPAFVASGHEDARDVLLDDFRQRTARVADHGAASDLSLGRDEAEGLVPVDRQQAYRRLRHHVPKLAAPQASAHAYALAEKRSDLALEVQ